jgi:hypothetical protein
MGMETQELADEMYKIVAESDGGRYAPKDLFRVVLDKYKSEGVNKSKCKVALKTLIEGEKLAYTVLNGSCSSMICLFGTEE